MNKKNLTIIILAFMLVVTLIIVLLPRKKEMLWSYNDGKRNIHIFGTLDLRYKEMYPLNEKIASAFTNSDLVVVQSIYQNEDAEKIKTINTYYGFSRDEKTLKDYLSDEIYQKLTNSLSKVELSIDRFNKNMPWNIIYTYTSHLDNLYKDKNILRHFYYFRKEKQNKKLEILEPSYTMMEILFKLKDHDNYVNYALNNANTKERIEKLKIFKKEMKLDSLQYYLIESAKSAEEYYENYFVKRNIELKNKINKITSENSENDIFIVLKIENLLGENGILELFDREGIKFN